MRWKAVFSVFAFVFLLAPPRAHAVVVKRFGEAGVTANTVIIYATGGCTQLNDVHINSSGASDADITISTGEFSDPAGAWMINATETDPDSNGHGYTVAASEFVKLEVKNYVSGTIFAASGCRP